MSETRQIVCGHCGRTNRLPAERTPEGARCGACHQPMFTGHPIEVDEEAFGRHVVNSDIPVLVDVWAPGAGHAAPWRRCSNAPRSNWSRRSGC
ncbi:hypothetical protein ACVME8_000608 [Bradyrhizobium diazoefficiens]